MLNGEEVSWLANELDQAWTVDKLSVFLSDELDIDFTKLAPGLGLKERVVELVKVLTKDLPMRDREFLEKLEAVGNAQLKNAARKLLQPSYLSPTKDPLDAILLGAEAFVDQRRSEEGTAQVHEPLAVHHARADHPGGRPCGKSYSWSFLRHLAWASVGATAIPVPLCRTGYTQPQGTDRGHLLPAGP